MLEVIQDAWPWVLGAFVLGFLLGWLFYWLWCRRIYGDLEAEVSRLRAAGTDSSRMFEEAGFSEEELAEATSVIGRRVRLNDLRLVEGIGPKIEKLMNQAGIRTWRQLEHAPLVRLQAVLDDAGNRYAMHDPGTWARQAGLLADGKWAVFKALTDELDGGRP